MTGGFTWQDLDGFADLTDSFKGLTKELRELKAELAKCRESGLMEPVKVPATGRNATPLVTTRKVAEMAGVDPKTVRRWRQAGTMPPGAIVGSSYRWNRDDIRAWLEDGGLSE